MPNKIYFPKPTVNSGKPAEWYSLGGVQIDVLPKVVTANFEGTGFELGVAEDGRIYLSGEGNVPGLVSGVTSIIGSISAVMTLAGRNSASKPLTIRLIGKAPPSGITIDAVQMVENDVEKDLGTYPTPNGYGPFTASLVDDAGGVFSLVDVGDQTWILRGDGTLVDYEGLAPGEKSLSVTIEFVDGFGRATQFTHSVSILNDPDAVFTDVIIATPPAPTIGQTAGDYKASLGELVGGSLDAGQFWDDASSVDNIRVAGLVVDDVYIFAADDSIQVDVSRLTEDLSLFTGTSGSVLAAPVLAPMTIEGITFDVPEAATNAGVDPYTGEPWIVMPEGTLLTQPTDALGRTLGPAELNPTALEPAKQPYMPGLPVYSTDRRVVWPYAVSHGDVIVQSVLRDGWDNSNDFNRSGVAHATVAIHILSTPPTGPLPPAVRYTGRTGAFETYDDSGLLTALPGAALDLGANEPTEAEVQTAIDAISRCTVLAGCHVSPNNNMGYQVFLPHVTGVGSNYGESLSARIERLVSGLVAHLSLRPSIILALFRFGRSIYPSAKMGLVTRGNGGHYTWQLLALMVYLACTGKMAELADIVAVFRINPIDQPFIATAEQEAMQVPHDNLDWPYPWKTRNIVSVDPFGVNPLEIEIPWSNSGERGDPAQVTFSGCFFERNNDGARSRIVSQRITDAAGVNESSSTLMNSSRRLLVTLDAMPASPFVAGQAIHTPPERILLEGDVDWVINGTARMNTWNSQGGKYRDTGSSQFAGPWLGLHLMGLMVPELLPLNRYVPMAAKRTLPNATTPYPDPFPRVSENTREEIIAIYDLVSDDYAPSVAVATLNDFQRDRAMFGAGNAAGLNAAPVPLSGGSDTPNSVIDARAVLDSDDTTVVAFKGNIAVADGAGQWSGSLSIPKTPFDWCHIEVRADGGEWQRAPLETRCAAASLVVALGQSEFNRGGTVGFNGGLVIPAITDPDAVQFTKDPQWNSEDLAHVYCEDGNDLMTPAMAAYANEWAANCPGEKVMCMLATQSGSHPDWHLDDDDTRAVWSHYNGIVALGTMDGAAIIDIQHWHWNAANRSWADSHMLEVFRRTWGIDLAGNPDPVGTNEHKFEDFPGVDWTRTRLAVGRPHRFESNDDTINQAHISIINDWDAPGGAGRVLPPTFAPIAYRNAIGDFAHPDHQSFDGLPLLFRYLAVMDQIALGLLDVDLPALDTADWHTDYVDLSSSAGAITTNRINRFKSPPDAVAYPWWVPVADLHVNGVDADNVSIAGGAIRVEPNSGVFNHLSYINFVTGAGSGLRDGVTGDENIEAEFWEDLPVVDIGVPSGLLIPVLPIPNQEDIATTLAGGVPMFGRVSDGTTHTKFESINAYDLGPGKSAFTARFSARFVAADINQSSWAYLDTDAGRFEIKFDAVTNSGGGGGNVKMLNAATGNSTYASFAIPPKTVPMEGELVEFLMAGRFHTEVLPGFLWLQVNGGLVARVDIAAGSANPGGYLDPARSLSYLASGGPGDFSALEFWWDARQTAGEVPDTGKFYPFGETLEEMTANPAFRGGVPIER